MKDPQSDPDSEAKNRPGLAALPPWCAHGHLYPEAHIHRLWCKPVPILLIRQLSQKLWACREADRGRGCGRETLKFALRPCSSSNFWIASTSWTAGISSDQRRYPTRWRYATSLSSREACQISRSLWLLSFIAYWLASFWGTTVSYPAHESKLWWG